MHDVDDPTCHDCLTARMLRAERDNLLAEIAVLKGMKAIPGAVDVDALAEAVASKLAQRLAQ